MKCFHHIVSPALGIGTQQQWNVDGRMGGRMDGWMDGWMDDLPCVSSTSPRWPSWLLVVLREKYKHVGCGKAQGMSFVFIAVDGSTLNS